MRKFVTTPGKACLNTWPNNGGHVQTLKTSRNHASNQLAKEPASSTRSQLQLVYHPPVHKPELCLPLRAKGCANLEDFSMLLFGPKAFPQIVFSAFGESFLWAPVSQLPFLPGSTLIWSEWELITQDFWGSSRETLFIIFSLQFGKNTQRLK